MPLRGNCHQIVNQTAPSSMTLTCVVLLPHHDQILTAVQLAGEKEVKGQVKLAFKGTNQSKMVVSRNIELTVKKTTRAFKTLDGNLTTYKGGERSSLSERVAELNKLMPHHLGVSKAVLNMVVFCHQDESLWPMSEPAQLKKKFDEIFEALKYTKALDSIKAVRKKNGEDLKVLRTKENSTKQIKTLGDKVCISFPYHRLNLGCLTHT